MPKNFAATRAVNPPGIEPKITEAQLWKGLEKKALDPTDFLPQVTKVQITKGEGDKFTRVVAAMGDEFTEDVTIYQGTIIYFENITFGGRVVNVVSYSADNELQLTYSFTGGIPGTGPSGGDGQTAEELNKVVGAAVQKTIDVVRGYIRDGLL